MYRFRKLTAICLIVAIFSVAQSNRAEANPLVLVPGAIMGALLLSTAAVKFYKPLSSQWDGASAYHTAGSLARIAYATAKVVNQYGQDSLMGSLSALRASASSVYDYVKDKASLFPKLYNAYVDDGFKPETTTTDEAFPDGTVFKIGDTYYQTTALVGGSNTPGNTTLGTNSRIFGGQLYVYAPPVANQTVYPNLTCYGSYKIYNFTVSTQPIPKKKAPADVSTALNGVPTSETVPVSDVYTGEIDNLISSAPNIFTPVDTANPAVDSDTAPPLTFPATINDPKASPISAPSVTATTTATSKAATAADAKTALDTYTTAHPEATVLNDPTLADLTKAYTDAKAAADAAADLADKLGAEESVATPSAVPDELKKIDFSPFLRLNGVLADKFPFTLLTEIGALYQVFNQAPVAPVFNIPIGGTTLTIDCSSVDIVASCIRYSIALFISVGTILFVVRRYTD